MCLVAEQRANEKVELLIKGILNRLCLDLKTTIKTSGQVLTLRR